MQQFYSPKTLVTWDIRAPACMALQSIISAALICLTPKTSLLRKASLPILLYLSLVSIQTASAFTLQLMLYLGFSVGSWVNVFICFNHLCLQPLDDVDIRREMHKWKTISAKPSLVARLYFTTAMLWSFRGIGTSFEIKSLPKFPGNIVPSKPRFLLRQCSLITFQYLLLDLIISQPQSPEAAEAWAEGKEWLWLPLNPYPVTVADLAGRSMVTFMNWYLMGRILVDIWYRIFSVIWVGLGISEVKQWPPLYGNYSDCYTLRRYFNKFWQQCLRIPMKNIAAYITHDLLGLKPSLLQSYLTITIVFFLSGQFHMLDDYCIGMASWRLSGAMQCFLLIVPGIIVEDGVQWLWYRLIAKRSDFSYIQTFGKLIGYVWVFLWLTLVTPMYNFPLMRIEHNPTIIVPWSVVKYLT